MKRTKMVQIQATSCEVLSHKRHTGVCTWLQESTMQVVDWHHFVDPAIVEAVCTGDDLTHQDCWVSAHVDDLSGPMEAYVSIWKHMYIAPT
jgi:hypothetical protein